MWYFTQIYRLTNFLPGICKNINRTKWLHPVQTQACNYTKKSAEEKLGIDKPKRPLNPFFKFMSQMRPALLTKIPGISTKDAIVWSSQHWQQLDSETKAKMAEEYKKDLEEYKEKKAKYQASLTDLQKTDIKSMNDKIIASKNRRKLKCFMTQMRPALLAKNPGITSKEAIAWSSKHWQQSDSETKSQMVKEYEKDMEDYKRIKSMYESSLTEQQKEDIKRIKEEMSAAREKRKIKAELKELGKPKRPMSSYFLFAQSRKDVLQSNQSMKEYQEKVKAEWSKLSDNEKVKFEKQAHDLMDKYKKDLQSWELKMISIGHTDLVCQKRQRQKAVKGQ